MRGILGRGLTTWLEGVVVNFMMSVEEGDKNRILGNDLNMIEVLLRHWDEYYKSGMNDS